MAAKKKNTKGPKMDDTLYVIRIEGGTDLEVHGPYGSYAERLEAARGMHEEEDVTIRLNISKDGKPEVEAFGQGELEA